MSDNRTTHALLGIILVLLLLNLVMTTILVGKQNNQVNLASDSLDPEIATVWGKRVVELYNRRDAEAFYRLFSPQARDQFTPEQFEAQLENLSGLFGDIESYSFINAVKLGEKGAERYFQLFYRAGVSARENPATLKLSLIVDNDAISVHGFSLNATLTAE